MLVSFRFVQDLFKQTAKCLSHKIVEKTEGLAPDKGNIVEQPCFTYAVSGPDSWSMDWNPLELSTKAVRPVYWQIISVHV